MRSPSAACPKQPDTPFIRPATPEEIAEHDALDDEKRELQREIQQRFLANAIWREVTAKWGFDDSGVPLDEKDKPRWRRVQILEEFGERLEQLGMLEGSEY